jgi:starch synthase
LGTGEKEYEELFRRLARQFPKRFAVRIAYDEKLAHKIEAGADMFLMPSRYEPSGLNQMYSLKYGTPPIVRATGGLDDTVEHWDPQTRKGTGFKFADYNPEAMLGAVRQGLDAFRDRAGWEILMRNGMAKDFSWTASAKEYVRVYERARQMRTAA